MRILAILAVVVVCLVCAGQAAQAAGSNPGTKYTLVHGEAERSYRLYVPSSIDLRSGEKFPLVIVLHGGGGNGVSASRMSGFSEKAEVEKFIVAYPDGSGKRDRDFLLTWNAEHCCGHAMTSNVDDVGFISRLIDTLIAEKSVDPRRVYVTGMSNGGMMAHRLGIEIPEKIAAIAPVVAGLFGDEGKPHSAVSVVIFNGALDKSVLILGGKTGGRSAAAWDGTELKPGVYQETFWATANECSTKPRKGTIGKNVTVTKYSCPAGVDVMRYVVHDNGHAWPGGEKGRSAGDEPSESLNATDVMWAFFKGHSK
jgi:polyhydroxybutyrate depolymerase